MLEEGIMTERSRPDDIPRNTASDPTRSATPADRDGTQAAARPDDRSIVAPSVGGLTGTAAGAAIGSIAGPIGTVIGALAGAVGGWWAGRDLDTDKFGFDHTRDDVFRNHFVNRASNSQGGIASYDQARPAYQLGHLAAQNPDYRGKSFDEVEGDMKQGWNDDIEKTVGYNWNEARSAVAHAFESGNDPARR